MEDPIVSILNKSVDDMVKKREILIDLIIDSPFSCFLLTDLFNREEKILISIAEIAGVKDIYMEKAYMKNNN